MILRTFALDALVAVGLDGDRFQTLIGLGFLLIVLFSPDGVIGFGRRWLGRAARSRARKGRRGHEHDRRTFSRGGYRQRD